MCRGAPPRRRAPRRRARAWNARPGSVHPPRCRSRRSILRCSRATCEMRAPGAVSCRPRGGPRGWTGVRQALHFGSGTCPCRPGRRAGRRRKRAGAARMMRAASANPTTRIEPTLEPMMVRNWSMDCWKARRSAAASARSVFMSARSEVMSPTLRIASAMPVPVPVPVPMMVRVSGVMA